MGELALSLNRWLHQLGLAGLATGVRSSVGAAARPAHFSELEEYQRQLQQSAFSIPGTQVSAQEQANNYLQQILAALNNFPETIGRALVNAIGLRGQGQVGGQGANPSVFPLLTNWLPQLPWNQPNPNGNGG